MLEIKTSFWASHKVIVVVILVVSILGFTGLEDVYLWQDEACTAVVGRNLLKYGYPNAWDGRNLLEDPGDPYPAKKGPYFVNASWLQFYVVALSFAFFGDGTFTARFPFVLCGILTLPVVYCLTWRLTKHRFTAELAVILLGFSVPFLLYIRQCRYYALVLLATVWILDTYLRVIDNPKKPGHWFYFGSGLVFLFHSFAPIFFGISGAILLHWLLCGLWRKNTKPMIITCILVSLLTFPWLIYSGQHRAAGAVGLTEWLTLSADYVADIHFYAFPLWLVVIWLSTRRVQSTRLKWAGVLAAAVGVGLVGLAFLQVLPGRTHSALSILLIVLVGAVALMYWGCNRIQNNVGLLLVVCGLTLLLVPALNFHFFRYILNLLPLLAILGALILAKVFSRQRLVGTLLTLLFLCTNLIHAFPFWLTTVAPLDKATLAILISRSPISYFAAIVANRPLDKAQDAEAVQRRLEVVKRLIPPLSSVRSDLASFLYEVTHEYTGPTEAIVRYLKVHADSTETVLTNYGNAALIFYTPLQVIFTRDFSSLPIQGPDWVIIRQTPWVSPNLPNIKRFQTTYEPIVLDVPDLVWENRPDPGWHFSPFPKTTNRLIIYRKRV